MKLTLLLVITWFALCSAITREEKEFFGTTGMAESNTGIVGYVTVTSSGNKWRFESNGVPDHDTGKFPGINPNSIQAQSFTYLLPKNPSIAEEPSCLPGGPIAMAVNGVIMYNPWDADGENAVEGEGAEIFDQCDGHPDNRGTYHYHKMPSSCLFEDEEGVPSPLIGVAFDGFAIYGPNDENGNRLTSADLDECHGRVNANGVYQYHTTFDFPYILGCYKGIPVGRARGNCYFASDADNEGDIVSGNAQRQSQGARPRPNRRNGRSVETEGSRQKRGVSTHGEPMLPANLFKRRLPSGYKKWLSDIVFNRV